MEGWSPVWTAAPGLPWGTIEGGWGILRSMVARGWQRPPLFTGIATVTWRPSGVLWWPIFSMPKESPGSLILVPEIDIPLATGSVGTRTPPGPGGFRGGEAGYNPNSFSFGSMASAQIP